MAHSRTRRGRTRLARATGSPHRPGEHVERPHRLERLGAVLGLGLNEEPSGRVLGIAIAGMLE